MFIQKADALILDLEMDTIDDLFLASYVIDEDYSKKLTFHLGGLGCE